MPAKHAIFRVPRQWNRAQQSKKPLHKWYSCLSKCKLTEGEAHVEAQRINAANLRSGRFVVAYTCDYCPNWHVGGRRARDDVRARQVVEDLLIFDDRVVGCLLVENAGPAPKRYTHLIKRIYAAHKRRSDGKIAASRHGLRKTNNPKRRTRKDGSNHETEAVER